ncbi:GNAT family N-acetyltransferase [Naasia lichenicola]|nr:GNAT family N-acetyltransferase [Naasia lichenicola]
MVNAAYAVGEAGMWRPDTPRTTPDDIAELIAAGELLVAHRRGDALGCVRVQPLDDATWGFGMLAVAPDNQGGGTGGALVDAAEEHAREGGAATMQLEILTPTDAVNPNKARLQRWYAARGYALDRSDAVEDHLPELVPLLAGPCTYDVWRRRLA